MAVVLGIILPDRIKGFSIGMHPHKRWSKIGDGRNTDLVRGMDTNSEVVNFS